MGDCPGIHCHGNESVAELLATIAASDGGVCDPLDELAMLQRSTTVDESRCIVHENLAEIRALTSLSSAIAAANGIARPFAWCDEWVSLASGVRSQGYGLVIKLFGRGVASQQFANHEWVVVRSIDVFHTDAFNVLNHVIFTQSLWAW